MSQWARNNPEAAQRLYKPIPNYMSNDYTDFIGPADWLSTCCGSRALGELSDDQGDGQRVGICDGCRDHATFEKSAEE